MVMVLSLASCSNTSGSETNDTTDTTDTTAEPSNETIEDSTEEISNSSESNILIAYFSRTGNTETIANMILDEKGGRIFKIETITPYSDDYNECVDVAKKEQEEDARPELSNYLDSIDEYDTIFLGYPNWWGTMPMAMFTFLERYDFSGKTIIPFCTHGGSALGSSERDIAELCPDANLLQGLAISGGSVGSAKDSVVEWLEGLNIE